MTFRSRLDDRKYSNYPFALKWPLFNLSIFTEKFKGVMKDSLTRTLPKDWFICPGTLVWFSGRALDSTSHCFFSQKTKFWMIHRYVEVQMEKNSNSKISPLFNLSSGNAVKCFSINCETKLECWNKRKWIMEKFSNFNFSPWDPKVWLFDLETSNYCYLRCLQWFYQQKQQKKCLVAVDDKTKINIVAQPPGFE
jgi:hypothetical protein